MFQLQARAWSLSEEGCPLLTPFGVSLPYPFTSPDNKHVWDELICNVSSKGMRDIGRGNIIFYKIEHDPGVSEWVRGESIFLSFKPSDLLDFLAGLTPHLSWWNVLSKYSAESVEWKHAGQANGTLLRAGLLCDTFSVWLLAQALAYGKMNNFSAEAFGNQEPNQNWVHVTVHAHDGTLAPRLGKLDEIAQISDMKQFDLEYAHAMSVGAQSRDSLAIWEIKKGHGACKPTMEASKTELLKRNWKDPASWSRGFDWWVSSCGRIFSTREYPCTDRITRGLAGIDLVRFGLWRFFHIKEDINVVALDWDVDVQAHYSPLSHILGEAGSVQLPGGTPRNPFAKGSAANPCGSMCPWQDPVPPPPLGGYTL